MSKLKTISDKLDYIAMGKLNAEQMEYICEINQEVNLKDREIEKLKEINKELGRDYSSANNGYLRLHSIIKEVREILKYHLSNPSGTKKGWHIDIWNSEDISKLNEDLGILDKVGDEK